MAYIDKDRLNEAMYHEAFEKDSDFQKWDGGCWIRYKLYENVLKTIPDAEVVEVKRGKWIFDSDATFRCSVCGDHMVRNVFPFCPWCGAKMEA